MIQQCDRIKLSAVGCGYTSCIKIGGIPILPPLITFERRQELEEDKKKAIEFEKRLKSQQDFKILANQSIFPQTQSLKHRPPVTRSLANRLAFESNESGDASSLPASPEKARCQLPSPHTPVPLPRQKREPSRLTCSVFDVTQYSDEGVVLFNKSRSNLSASMTELDLTSLCSGDETSPPRPRLLKSNSYILDTPSSVLQEPSLCSGDGCTPSKQGSLLPRPRLLRSNSYILAAPSPVLLETSLCSGDGYTPSNQGSPRVPSPRPRLLRSNSYTLAAPSPVLLEHIKKQAELESGISLERKRLSLDLTDLNDSDYKTLTSRSSGNNATIADLHFSQSSDEQGEHINDDTQKGCDITVGHISGLVEDLAEIHFGPNKVESKDETRNVQTRVAEAEAALHEVLNDIPENYARDIMELLERHKLEQEVKLESYAKFKQKLMDEHVNTNGLTLPKRDEISSTVKESQVHEFDPLLCHEETTKEAGSSFEDDSKSCTIQLADSSTDTLNVLNTSTPLIDLESKTEHLFYFDYKSSICITGSSHSPRASRSTNCSRELFAEKPDKALQRAKEEWAAGVLTAAAKGYLVRRLQRTERIKNLVQTIRDALLCAMSLHTENWEAIQPSDVELHRRLIQQVSAACYEFHEVFFTFTTKEQMAMIALDRQRLQEKQKRPLSSSSQKMHSSRSASKDQKHSFSARQKKSLTPSFAA